MWKFVSKGGIYPIINVKLKLQEFNHPSALHYWMFLLSVTKGSDLSLHALGEKKRKTLDETAVFKKK